MKVYNNRGELNDDVNFIHSIIKDKVYKEKLVNQLFNQWKITSSDSPWYDNTLIEKEKNAVETLIKISGKGISNQWVGEHIIFNDVKKHKYNLRKR